jgi:hypothetical protein
MYMSVRCSNTNLARLADIYKKLKCVSIIKTYSTYRLSSTSKSVLKRKILNVIYTTLEQLTNNNTIITVNKLLSKCKTNFTEV